MGDWRGEPDELVDCCGKLPEIGQQRFELAGVIEEGYHAIADEAGRRVVAGDHKLEEARQDLLRGERIVLSGDEDADEIVARAIALGVNQIAQVGHDAVRGFHRLSRRVTGPPGEQHLEPRVQARAVGWRVSRAARR